MLSQKNKNLSGIRYKSYNFDRPSHIALSDFIRIQNSISPLNTEIEERNAYEERLRRLSREKSKNWNDSLEKKKKIEYEMAKRRFLEEEKRRRLIDEQEKRYLDARENMIIQKAKEHLFHEQDAVKSFNSKLLFCDMIKERDFQKEIKDKKKEINNIIEKQFFDMNLKNMEENDKREAEKKKIEDEKILKRMNMINDQIKEMKIKKIQEYEDNLIEGEIMKIKMKKALEDEVKERELREKKIQEQKEIFKKENEILIKEKEKLKMKEMEEDKKIEEFAKKKQELNDLRQKKEEEKMKKKLQERQKLIDAQFEYLQNLQKNEDEIIEKNVKISRDREKEEERIKKEKYDKWLNDINDFRVKTMKMKEEEKRKNKEDDIKYMIDYKIQMQKLKEEEIKEKLEKKQKERNLAEYQRLQTEEKRKLAMDDFAKLNQDAYKNLQRLDNENDDFIKYAEYHIQEYKKQGKNIHPLLIELKKYKQKYSLQ